MSSPATCPEVRVLLDRVRVLKLAHDQAYRQAVVENTPVAIHRAKVASDTLAPELERLERSLWFMRPEQVFDLRRQYESQIELLKTYKFVNVNYQRTRSGETREYISFIGIDHEEYELPSYEEILQRLKERGELVRIKADQGFKKLILVPFGLKLDQFHELFSLYLKEKNLKGPDNLHIDSREPFVMHPFDGGVLSGTNLDGLEKILYYPKVYSTDDPGGALSKEEVLRRRSETSHWSGGWNILLVEESESGVGVMTTSSKKKNKAKGEHYPRLPIQGENTARQCLALLQNEANGRFQYESGMTPEDWIMTVITHAEATGTLLDRHLHTLRVRSGVSFLTGSVYMAAGDIYARAVTMSYGKHALRDGCYNADLTNINVDRKMGEPGTARHLVLV